MKKIIPSLWFDRNAEEAVNFYLSVFRNSKIVDVTWYNEAGPGPAGQVMTIAFELNGLEFMAINGGPYFTFTSALSLLVPCDTQEEIDDLWEKLSKGGSTEQCGWLKDKFGVSWQIAPVILNQMLQDKNTARAANVTKAMLQMVKLDIETLKNAYERE